MRPFSFFFGFFAFFAACATTALADDGVFTKGPVFSDYGPVTAIDVTMPIPPSTAFRHSFDVPTDDFLPRIEMALSAMTAHAVLQQQGYTLNPF